MYLFNFEFYVMEIAELKEILQFHCIVFDM